MIYGRATSFSIKFGGSEEAGALAGAGGRGPMGASLIAKQALGGVGIDGRSEEVALGKIAAEAAEVIELRGFFDPLGDDLAVQFASESENEVDDVLAGAIGLHVGHERAVNLNDIGRETAQGDEGNAAGAEVINGSGEVETFELREHAGSEVRVGHRDAFGDAELKSAGLDLGVVQAGLDTVEQLRAGKVARREVHGEV